MNRRVLIAQIWPSRASRDQELSQRARENPGGLLLTPPLFTFEELLPLLLEQIELPSGWARLLDLAGPLLVQDLLLRGGGEAGHWAGLAAGRRLPRQLWRLLVEIKAAGLNAQALKTLAGERLGALARLLEQYQQRLSQLQLLDQADLLHRLEQALHKGDILPMISEWGALQVREALWLRTLDIRLLKALAQVVPVRIEFSLHPDGKHPALHRLLNQTAQILESGSGEGMEVGWRPEPHTLPPEMEFVCEAGRYTEVESLVNRILSLVESGVEASDLALVFPDLRVYGQMAAEIGVRLGLPLDFAQGMPLSSSSVVQALLTLLQLPLEGYPRAGLAQVLDSPYFAPSAFARKSGQAISAAEHLARAGYVDAREGWSEEWLNREIGGQKPEKRSWTDIAQACQKIKQKVDKYSHHNNIIDYIELILGEIDSLGLGHLRKVQADWPGPALGPGPAHLQARDLKAMDQLRGVLTSLQAAARQVEAHEPLSPGRLLSLVRETLAQKELRLPSGPRPGLRVLRVEQAAGLRLHTVLAGGLNQGQLPARPQGRHLLSGGERLALGRLAGLPVWRTDDEEYAGQQLRLYGLISQAGQGAVLAYAAHDSQGREQKPAFLLKELATSHDEKLGTPQGGVFGALPPLVQAREPLALWGGLAQALLGTGADPESAPLAQAALWHLVQSDQEQGQRWSDLAQRSLLENSRQELDLLPGPERSLKSGPFSGCLGSDPALDVLGRVLSHPSQRRLSPSSLETYAACPQAWFFSRILGLEAWPIPAWDLERSREGEWVHATLKMFFNPEDFQINAQAGAVSRRLQDCLQEAREQLLASAASGHAAIWEARQPVLFQALSRVVSREMKDLAQTPVRAVEMEFGPEGAELRVLVKEGEPLVLQGRLDRLDLGQGMLRVTDYKHTTQDQNLRNLAKKEAQAKYAFQLPMYLAAARRMMADQAQPLSQLIGRLVPTALTHLKAFELELNPDDDLLAQDKEQRRRLAQDGRINLFNAVAGIWQRITKGDFTAQPEPGTCSYCQFSPLCRAQVSPGITGDRNEG